MFVKQSIIRIGLYSVFTPLEKRADFREPLPLEYPLSTIVIRVILSSLKIPLFQLWYICSIYSTHSINRCLTGPNQLCKVLNQSFRDQILFVKHTYPSVYENMNAANTRWFPQFEMVFKLELSCNCFHFSGIQVFSSQYY